MAEPNDEADYFLIRAREEQQRAEFAAQPNAAAAHRELAMRYSVKALMAHTNDEVDGKSGDDAETDAA